MTVIASFRDGLRILSDNPRLLAAAVIVASVGHLATFGELAGVPYGTVLGNVGWVLTFPFLLSGFIGMAAPAIENADASFDRFLRAGRRHYGRMLVAPIVLVAIVIGIFALIGVLSVVPLVLLFVADVAVGGAPLIAAGAFFVAGPWITLAVLLVTIVSLQFYATAIVVDNEDVTDAFRRSAGLVRQNVGSVLGFTLLWGVLTGAVLSPGYLLAGALTEAGTVDHLTFGSQLPQPVLVPVLVLVTAVAFAYSYTVYTAYYVRLVDETALRTKGTSTDPNRQ
ncbi:MAG: hypothetical protein ACI9EZ_001265 [Halobacteriales archaeon]|jgi:hypothetical protein